MRKDNFAEIFFGVMARRHRAIRYRSPARGGRLSTSIPCRNEPALQKFRAPILIPVTSIWIISNNL
jgi:hypothetical protein